MFGNQCEIDECARVHIGSVLVPAGGKKLAFYEFRTFVSSVHHSCTHTTGTNTPSPQSSEGHERHTFLQSTEYFTNTVSLHRVGYYIVIDPEK